MSGFRRRLMGASQNNNKIWVPLGFKDGSQMWLYITPDTPVYAVATTTVNGSGSQWFSKIVFSNQKPNPNIYNTYYLSNFGLTRKNYSELSNNGDINIMIDYYSRSYREYFYAPTVGNDDIIVDTVDYSSIASYEAINIQGEQVNAYVKAFDYPVYIGLMQESVDIQNWYVLVDNSVKLTEFPMWDALSSYYNLKIAYGEGNWRRSTTLDNPDDTKCYGVFESNSNYNVHSSSSTITLHINDLDRFAIYIRSNAESDYDYVTASELDSSTVKASTKGNQHGGNTIDDYTYVEYTNIGGGSHTITVTYTKDHSQNIGDDRGYLLIERLDIE